MVLAVGIMSGTSLDGIDVALVDIEGVDNTTRIELKSFITYKMDINLKNKIEKQLSIPDSSVDEICSLNFELAEEFSKAVMEICYKENIESSDLEFVASHGQTIFHQPYSTERLIASTLQLGDASILAERLKTTIVSNFRTRDMAVGGQGAPLVPFSEYILYSRKDRTIILQNIGGIGNATIIPANGGIDDVIAFDTGPGNMMINYLCEKFYHKEFDNNGEYALLGKINNDLFKELINHDYLKREIPKTTGREEFGKEYCDYLFEKYDYIDKNDFIHTVTYYTSYCISHHIKQFNLGNKVEMIIGGGGAYNKTLVDMIKNMLSEFSVSTQEENGFSSDAKEAIAFVILANQTLHRRPSNVKSATGAKKNVILGSITYY